MKCPACNKVMIVVEHEKIEIDHCLNCLGVWFDSGELELLMETMHLKEAGLSMKDILASPEASSPEKKRKCPICGRKMRKATVGQKPEVLVDACRQGDGLWFDDGEVGHLITQLPPDSPAQTKGSSQQLVTFLGKVFEARGKHGPAV